MLKVKVVLILKFDVLLFRVVIGCVGFVLMIEKKYYIYQRFFGYFKEVKEKLINK